MTIRKAGVADGIRLAKFILALWLAAMTNSAAQTFWQQTNGPSKGSVSSLAINLSGHIFAGTDSEVFRSTNNGDSWTKVNIGLTSNNVYSFTINSTGHIFVGTDSGVFRSTSNGDSWAKASAGLTSNNVYSLAINSDRHVFAGTDGGVFRSIDNGDTWSQVNNGLTNPVVRSLAINPITRDILAGTSGGGVFRSTNNGDSWAPVNMGLAGVRIEVYSLAINSSGHLFAATFFYGVFRSIDNGDTWTQVNTGLTNADVVSFAINFTTQDIFAGTNDGWVLRSTNDGDSWTLLNTGLSGTSSVNSLAINSSGHIFAGTSGFWGLRSMDNGETWRQIGGLPNTGITSLAINLSGHIFAGTYNDGLFRSIDNGNTWTPVNTGLTTTNIRSLAINSSGDIFAGTDEKIFRSTNNGETWASIGSQLSHTSVEALAISPNGNIFAGTCCDVSRSTDNGNTWQDPGLISANAINVRALAINSKGHIFVATADDEIFRSTNNGDNWTPVKTGLPRSDVRSLSINARGHIFAGTNDGVFRSTNNGDTWEPANNGLNSRVASFAINSKGHIFAGTNGGVFRSIDNGESWKQINAGLTSLTVGSLAISPSGIIFAGTSGGVFRNIDLAPPVITHINPSPQPISRDFTVDAIITDQNGVASVILNYRRGGDPSFKPVVMVPSADNHYYGSIPVSAMTSRGVEYYFIVTDSVGNITYLPPSGIFSVQVRVSGEGEVKRDTLGNPIPQPNGSEQSAYRLVSVPLALDNKSPRTILEDHLGSYNIKKWRFYELDADQKLREFPKTTEMQPGKAFWLIVKDAGKVIDTGPGISNRTDKKYEIPLHPMWNMIGNPFNFSIPVDSLRLKSGKRVELRTYTGSWNEPASNPVTAIQPFEGYAIFVDLADTLLVNPDLSASASSLSKAIIPTRTNQVLWSIRILAQSQEARDEDNVAGAVANVSNNWDETNHPEPPMIGEYVSVSFPHPELEKLSQNYCTDFRPESSEGYVWPLAVATNIRDKVHLTFEGLESVPEENEIWLIDEVVPVAQNLRQNQSYVVAASSPEHPKLLKLVVGKRDFVEEKIADTQVIPTTYELNQNFPNPFNPATTIRYGLPQNERVTLKIYNILGEEIITLLNDELQAAGYHVAIWDGRNKLGEVVGSGVYVYRFRAGSFNAIKKMALVK